MRIWWNGLACLVATLLALVGCSSTDSNITKPPPIPPSYVLPPQDEARYSSPPAYPEKTLNENKKKNNDAVMPGGIRRTGAGMGGSPGGGY
jgi:hypothetical protein